jgi:DNA-directed RNA polymerase subunit M/transcription elongation factor TFIIS
MQFCPNCNNILDISKTAPKNTVDFSTPTTVSDSDDGQSKIEKLVNVLKNPDISHDDIEYFLEGIDLKTVIKHTSYLSLSQKDKDIVNKNINTLSDAEISSFYKVCTNCTYHQKISSRDLIISKISIDTSTIYDDIKKYTYMRYDSTLPHTRDYICPNKLCESLKDYSKRDAVWFRPFQSYYQTYFVCCDCGEVWQAT